jgi:hypothetical protein
MSINFETTKVLVSISQADLPSVVTKADHNREVQRVCRTNTMQVCEEGLQTCMPCSGNHGSHSDSYAVCSKKENMWKTETNVRG